MDYNNGWHGNHILWSMMTENWHIYILSKFRSIFSLKKDHHHLTIVSYLQPEFFHRLFVRSQYGYQYKPYKYRYIVVALYIIAISIWARIFAPFFMDNFPPHSSILSLLPWQKYFMSVPCSLTIDAFDSGLEKKDGLERR